MTPYFDKLPDELISLIILLLPVVDILRCRLVSPSRAVTFMSTAFKLACNSCLCASTRSFNTTLKYNTRLSSLQMDSSPVRTARCLFQHLFACSGSNRMPGGAASGRRRRTYTLKPCAMNNSVLLYIAMASWPSVTINLWVLSSHV